MNPSRFQRFLNGITLGPRYSFDCGLHIAKILFSRKSDLSAKEALELCFFVSIFFDKINVAQQLRDIYYWKQSQIVQLIHSIVTTKPFKTAALVNLNKLPSYSETHQQQYALRYMQMLQQFVGPENFHLSPSTEEKHLDVYFNYFGDKPDFSVPIPDDLLYREYFSFYQIQQQNTFTNIRILKQLILLNPKFLLDLSTLQDVHLFGGARQMVRIKVYLTKEVIGYLQKNFNIKEENVAKLAKIEEYDIRKDVMCQQQENPKQWTYSSDILCHMIQSGVLSTQLIDDCLQEVRVSPNAAITLDVSLETLNNFDQTIKYNRVVNQVVIMQKYVRDSADFLVSNCDSQLLKPFVKLLTLYQFINGLEGLVQPVDYPRVFGLGADKSVYQHKSLTDVMKQLRGPKQGEARNVYHKYMGEMARNVPQDLSNIYFDDSFGMGMREARHLSDTEQTNIIVSFIDPITLSKIQRPSRGSRCNHIQPLDESTFVINGPCPFCGWPVNEILPDYICMSLMEALKRAKIDAKNVELDNQTFQVINYELFSIEDDDSVGWFEEEADTVQTQQITIDGTKGVNAETHSPSRCTFIQTVSNEKQIRPLGNTTPQGVQRTCSLPRSVLYSKSASAALSTPQLQPTPQLACLCSDDEASSCPSSQAVVTDLFVQSMQCANSLQSRIELRGHKEPEPLPGGSVLDDNLNVVQLE